MAWRVEGAGVLEGDTEVCRVNEQRRDYWGWRDALKFLAVDPHDAEHEAGSLTSIDQSVQRTSISETAPQGTQRRSSISKSLTAKLPHPHP